MKNREIEKNLSLKIYVSPGRKGGGDGTKNSPYASVKDAQSAMKKAIAAGLCGDAGIVFTGGRYYLDETVFIGENDFDENHRIYYTSADGEDVCLVGGTPLTG